MSTARGKYDPSLVRNVAIIAHVDHGKTTLMDKLLEKCGTNIQGNDRVMDSNEHEKERGITITSHSDFGGEVERILSMVDGVVLLVDATEGPMSQTKFVLSKALQNSKPAIVVLNKVDRDGHRADEVEEELFELFYALSDNEALLEYPVLYASAKQGWVSSDIADRSQGMIPLLDAIVEHMPAADRPAAPFALAVNTISTDNHLGRIVTGKVEYGSIKLGDKVKGLTRVDVAEAYSGEIVSIAGCDAGVADTVAAPERSTPVVTIPQSPPVISMTMIKDRLHKEVENNVTLQLQPGSDSESINVQGRGELQIGILIETMRREGFELTVSPPNVLSQMSTRKGNLVEHEIMGLTRGNATVNSTFSHYDSVRKSDFTGLQKHKLVSMDTGKTTGYALNMVEERGTLFVEPGEDVYTGMIVGECARSAELDVNPCRMKKLTNMRTTGAEEKVTLTPPRKMNTEEMISYMDEDEVLEITPEAVRLRKKILDPGQRHRANKAKKVLK
eukprot:GSChrysophyteH1.ASY1.ANO1.2545.1 assembled CDS